MSVTHDSRAENRLYDHTHRAQIKERKRLYYLKRREELLAHYKTPKVRAQRRAYYARTIERRRQLDRERYQRDRVKRLADNKAYRDKYHATLKVKAAARAKADRFAHPDKFLFFGRRDRKRHAVKRRAWHNNWQRTNRDKGRMYEARYAAKNPGFRTAKNNRRRVRVLAAKADGTAEPFIKKIRSTKQLPCNYCGKLIRGKTAHIDHMMPLSKGGTHTADNLCAACEFCNCSKCDRTLAEWIPPIRRPVMVGV